MTSWAVRVHPWETQLAWLAMAALAFREPDLSLAELEERLFPPLLGLSGTEGSRLMRDLGCPLPFARMHENGIQFNRLKDPVPAPSGYIHTVIERWRKIDGEIERQRAERTRNADALAQALEILCRQVGRGSGDSGFLQSLAHAAYFQTWAARFARAILSDPADDGEWAKQRTAEAACVARVRVAMEVWAREWMTPRHAKLIAHLLFDRVEGFLRGE